MFVSGAAVCRASTWSTIGVDAECRGETSEEQLNCSGVVKCGDAVKIFTHILFMFLPEDASLAHTSM